MAKVVGGGGPGAVLLHGAGNGWKQDEGGVHLVAALHGSVTVVLTTMPDGPAVLIDSISALQSRFCREHQSELVKVQLAVRKRKPNKSIGELMRDVLCVVRIMHLDIAASTLESLT